MRARSLGVDAARARGYIDAALGGREPRYAASRLLGARVAVVPRTSFDLGTLMRREPPRPAWSCLVPTFWTQEVLVSHGSAALTPRHRLRLARSVVDEDAVGVCCGCLFRVSYPTAAEWALTTPPPLHGWRNDQVQGRREPANPRIGQRAALSATRALVPYASIALNGRRHLRRRSSSAPLDLLARRRGGRARLPPLGLAARDRLAGGGGRCRRPLFRVGTPPVVRPHPLVHAAPLSLALIIALILAAMLATSVLGSRLVNSLKPTELRRDE